MSDIPFPGNLKACRTMVFVDGENLAIRYNDAKGEEPPLSHVCFQKGVYVWSHLLNFGNNKVVDTIRRYYFTSLQGSDNDRNEAADRLRESGMQAPRVFPKTKARGSKRVDIALATAMLTHAHRGNYEVAVLVAGDEDYVPLVEAVIAEGRRVFVWFLQNGLSPALMRSADHFFDIGKVLLDEDASYNYSR